MCAQAKAEAAVMQARSDEGPTPAALGQAIRATSGLPSVIADVVASYAARLPLAQAVDTFMAKCTSRHRYATQLVWAQIHTYGDGKQSHILAFGQDQSGLGSLADFTAGADWYCGLFGQDATLGHFLSAADCDRSVKEKEAIADAIRADIRAIMDG